MIAYFDTSALIPLIISEPATDRATTCWMAADRVLTAAIAYAEARAALAAAQRAGRLESADLRRAVAVLDLYDDALEHVAATADLVRRAGALAEDCALRGYDAVHLASALTIASPDVVLVAGDGALLDAAQAMGLQTVPTA